MTDQQKAWIDNADYFSLLYKWRFAKTDDPLLSGEFGTGDYFAKVMREKENLLQPGEKVRISKDIGWERH